MAVLPPFSMLLVKDPGLGLTYAAEDTLATLRHACTFSHRSAFFFQAPLNLHLAQIEQAKLDVERHELSLASQPKLTKELKKQLNKEEVKWNQERNAANAFERKAINADIRRRQQHLEMLLTKANHEDAELCAQQQEQLNTRLAQLLDMETKLTQPKQASSLMQQPIKARTSSEIRDSLDCAAEVVRKLAALPVLALPSIPLDIGKEIIDLVAGASVQEAHTLSTVSKRLQAWFVIFTCKSALRNSHLSLQGRSIHVSFYRRPSTLETSLGRIRWYSWVNIPENAPS